MHRASGLLAVGLSLWVVSLSGCGDARPLVAGTSGGLSCSSCHGDSSRQPTAANPHLPAAPPVGTHGETATADRAVGAHQLHLNDGDLSRAVACDECHLVPTSLGHRNGTVDMSWGPLASANGAITGIVWDGSSCAATYCHGNFRNGNAGNAPTWTAARANPCGTCHGSPANPMPGGRHPITAQDCDTCHGPGYSWNGTSGTVDLDLHVNGTIEAPNLTCTSCHGTAGRASVANADPDQAAAPPVDTHGNTSSTAVGAHLVHVNGARSRPVPCAACHAGAVPIQPIHSTGTVTVDFGGLATTGGVTPGPYTPGSGGSCSATYCHGNFAGGNGRGPSPAWNASGTLGCTACHGFPPPLSATVHHPPNPDCFTCHAQFGPATHVNGAVERPLGCTACHGDLALTGQTLANASVAAPGYDAGSVDSTGSSAAAPAVGAHAAHLKGTTLRAAPIACTECHQLPPSDADVSHATGSGTGGARATLTWGSLARGAIDPWSGGAVTPAYAGSTSGSSGTTAGSCASTYCHGNFRNGNAANAPSWTSGAAAAACGTCHGTPPGGGHPSNAACGSCHGNGYSWNGTTGTVDPARHMNGVLDGGGEPTVGGTNCGGCHAAIFAAMTTGTPPAGSTRHFLGGGDSAVDPGAAWSAPLRSAAAYASASCVSMCHGDHPHDIGTGTTHEWNAYLDANARSSARSAATRDDTDFDAAQAGGGLCTSCHQYAVDAGHPAVAPAAFGASAHDYDSNTVGASSYAWVYALHDGGVFRRNCTKCHADPADGRPGDSTTPFGAVHASANPALLAGTVNPAGTPGGFVCYGCHGNGTTGVNLSGKDIASQIAKAAVAGQSGHPADSDAAHDSAAELAGAAFGNGLGGVGRHASCLDCHDPHQARAGAHATPGNAAGPALQGAWGAQLSSTPAFWTAPTGANFTQKTIVAGTDPEATLCFKCHSSFYGPLPASPSGGFPGTDTALEFNPANAGNWATAGTVNQWNSGETAGGFHPVLATAGGNLGAVRLGNLTAANLPWSTTARNLMTCTDCHESDTATDPSGPHGSAARFILRGPNTTWNATVANNGSIPAGTFCLNCHSGTFASSKYPAHTNDNHFVACFNCHAAIPHGGPRPGILNAGGGADAAVGGSIAGWDGVAPYWQGGAFDRLYIVSYPLTTTSTWSASNCGCNGPGHI